MQIIEVSANDTVPIWHYCKLEVFMQIFETGQIRLSNIKKLRESDPLEGVPTSGFLHAVNSFNALDKIQFNEEPDTAPSLSFRKKNLEIARRTFASCWTLQPDESEFLWENYGENQQGVALKSSVDLMESCFSEYCSDNEDLSLEHCRMEYDRALAHKDLEFNELEYVPTKHLFLKDGSQSAFRNELEYRFIIQNKSEILSSWYCASDTAVARHIDVPLNFREHIDQITLGAKVTLPVRNRLIELLKYSELDHLFKDSQFSRRNYITQDEEEIQRIEAARIRKKLWNISFETSMQQEFKFGPNLYS